MIDVVYSKSIDAKPYLKYAQDYLNKERLEHFLKLRLENDRLDCLAVSLLLQKYTGNSSSLYKDKRGCPRLKDGGYISISHSGGIVSLALSDTPVGIDIQQHTERDFFSIGKMVFCESEMKCLIESNNIEKTFYDLWCLKESYMKACGFGFSLPAKSFWFDLSCETPVLCTNTNDTENQWKFNCFMINNLSAAICYHRDESFRLREVLLT